MTSAATCGGSGSIGLASTRRVSERSKIPAWRHLAGGGARKVSNGLKPGLSTNDLAAKGGSNMSLGIAPDACAGHLSKRRRTNAGHGCIQQEGGDKHVWR